jgi:uncharacterized protein (TIGR02996 family)
MDLLSQHEAFLRAIFDAPDDDTPRLVYADFLQENGEEDRAELIRVQCELATLEGDRDERAQARTRELDRALARLAEGVVLSVTNYTRGFPKEWKTITLGIDQLLDVLRFRYHAVHSVPECFGVESVKLCHGNIKTGEPFDALFGLAAFARVTELNLEGNEVEEEREGDDPLTPFRIEPVITTAGVEALANHRGARRIISLDLTNNNLDNDAARALVKSPYLDNLKRLRLLEGNQFRGRVWQQVRERFGEDVVE